RPLFRLDPRSPETAAPLLLRPAAVAELVDDDQFVTRPAPERTAQLITVLGFDQIVHQSRGRRKPRTPALPAGRHAQSRCQMSFPCSRLAHKNERFRFLNVTAFGQLMNTRRRDLRRLAEVKLFQR